MDQNYHTAMIIRKAYKYRLKERAEVLLFFRKQPALAVWYGTKLWLCKRGA
jgi:hypothetical protein